MNQGGEIQYRIIPQMKEQAMGDGEWDWYSGRVLTPTTAQLIANGMSPHLFEGARSYNVDPSHFAVMTKLTARRSKNRLRGDDKIDCAAI